MALTVLCFWQGSRAVDVFQSPLFLRGLAIPMWDTHPFAHSVSSKCGITFTRIRTSEKQQWRQFNKIRIPTSQQLSADLYCSVQLRPGICCQNLSLSPQLSVWTQDTGFKRKVWQFILKGNTVGLATDLRRSTRKRRCGKDADFSHQLYVAFSVSTCGLTFSVSMEINFFLNIKIFFKRGCYEFLWCDWDGVGRTGGSKVPGVCSSDVC